MTLSFFSIYRHFNVAIKTNSVGIRLVKTSQLHLYNNVMTSIGTLRSVLHVSVTRLEDCDVIDNVTLS